MSLVLDKNVTDKENYIISNSWNDLYKINNEKYNIAILNRIKDSNTENFLNKLINSDFTQNIYACSDSQNIIDVMKNNLDKYSYLDEKGYDIFLNDIKYTTEKFFDIAKATHIEMYFAIIDNTKCPMYHFDYNDLRLLCTYKGKGTIWVSNSNVNKNMLGKKDNSKIVKDLSKINHTNEYDICILKGSKYPKNSNNAVIHRSPDIYQGEKRILLRLDSIR